MRDGNLEGSQIVPSALAGHGAQVDRAHPCEGERDMSRTNILSLAVGALVVAVAVLGYQVYQDRKEPKGVQINLGAGGISVEKK